LLVVVTAPLVCGHSKPRKALPASVGLAASLFGTPLTPTTDFGPQTVQRDNGTAQSASAAGSMTN
jgi:hypothetical protein